ncbi:hypothetical protein HN51_044215, partial [Arachis hypogaea]
FINRPHQSPPKSPVTADTPSQPTSSLRLSVTLVVTLRGVVTSPSRHCFSPHFAMFVVILVVCGLCFFYFYFAAFASVFCRCLTWSSESSEPLLPQVSASTIDLLTIVMELEL